MLEADTIEMDLSVLEETVEIRTGALWCPDSAAAALYAAAPDLEEAIDDDWELGWEMLTTKEV